MQKPIPSPALDHLIALSDDTGIIQHAILDVPNRSTGYCSDDVSRAFMVALAKLRLEPRNVAASRLASIYLAYLHDAQMDDGWFHNFMSYDRRWLDDRGTQDSFGRTIWALGYAIRHAPRETWRTVSGRMLEKALPRFGELAFLRSIAYSLIGLAHACESAADDAGPCREAMRPLADALKSAYLTHRDADWQWFEDAMTYDNARLCEAMLRSGLALRDDELIAIGLRTIPFYESVVVEKGLFVPIGSAGFSGQGDQFTEESRYSRGIGSILGGGVEYSLTPSVALTTELSAMRNRMTSYRVSTPGTVPVGSSFWMTSFRYTFGIKYNTTRALHLAQNPR